MGSVQKLAANLRNSLNGLLACWDEHSFRLEVYALVLGVGAVVWLERPLWAGGLALCSILLVMMAEALNTAIERLCDRITLAQDPQIKVVKDVASAGVFLSVLIAALAWMWLLFGVPG
jgi:diacylglycerol kinase (ATP)